MTYAENLAALSRTPVVFVRVTLDYCSLTFGVGACTATGNQCYNTWPTCKLKTAYTRTTKDYDYVSADVPQAIKTARPYIDKVAHLPTEIANTVTVTGKCTVNMLDDQDSDVILDPYYSSRGTAPATASYWKRFKTRNSNYKGRPVEIYEGFLGDAFSEYQQKFLGRLENIAVSVDGSVKIECVDLLKDIKGIQVPAKVSLLLAAAIDAAVTTITLYTPHQVSVDELAVPGYVRIDDEIIYYTAFNQARNEISGCTRGARDTVAAEHAVDGKVQPCRYYAPQNPYDLLKNEMLKTDGGLIDAELDLTAFADVKAFDDDAVNFERLLSEPTDIEKLIFEMLELLDARLWSGENNTITIQRNVPNTPGRTYTYLSDAVNIKKDTLKPDDNEKSRFTRVVVYWNPKAIGKADDPGSYNNLDIAIEADAEGANELNAVIEKKLYYPWLSTKSLSIESALLWMRNATARLVFRLRDPQSLLDFRVELKDGDMRTGAFAIISTSAFLDKYGNATNDVYMIVKRDKSDPAEVSFKAVRLPFHRFGFIADDAATDDFANATDAEKEYCYICDENGMIGDVDASYSIY